jgi:hypothetical protein
MQRQTQKFAVIVALIGMGVCAYLTRGSGQEAVAPQNAGLQQILHNNAYPMTLQFKNLDGDWRRLNIGGPADAMTHVGLASTVMDDVYYTRGETINIGGETFLAAYQIENPNKYTSPLSANYNANLSQKLTPDTRLTLNLINLRNHVGLYDITPLNMQDEIRRINGGAPTQ